MSEIKTLRGAGTATVTDRRSEFIGYAVPVKTEQEALDFIKSVKKKHADARHNVSAYILNGGMLKRYSDDGEPQGSAGKPVLDVLEKNGLDGAAVVVTRYFGGILLGTGGLVRAYSSAASAAVADAGVIKLTECRIMDVILNYNDHARLGSDSLISGCGVKKTVFGADVLVRLSVKTDLAEEVKLRLTELTSGRAVIKDGPVELAEFSGV